MAGEFVEHVACHSCGSSDGAARYSDGWTHCFVCGKRTGPKGTRPSLEHVGYYAAIEDRGLAIKTCKQFDYRLADESGRIVHLSTSRTNGVHTGWHVRRTKPKGFFWSGKPGLDLFGQHLWKSGPRLIITEGEIDCLTIAQVLDLKTPVVSVPNGSSAGVKDITRNLEWINKFDEVILAFDQDVPGRELLDAVAPLIDTKVRVMTFGGFKDANELYLADHKSAERLLKEIHGAAEWRPDGIVNGRDLLNLLLTPPPPGVDLCYPKLSEMIQGADEKRLYLWTAGSGIGKSTAAHEVIHDLVHRHGYKAGVMALEESVRETALRHLSIHESKPLHLMEHNPDTIRRLYNEVLKSGRYEIYDHFGTTDPDGLIGKMSYMRKALKCNVILLDHISIVMSGATGQMYESEAKRIDVFMTRLRSFIEATKVMVHAIVHLKRPQVGKSYNEGRTVALTDLRGSASLEQLSDFVIALERDQQGKQQDVSRIRLLKNRKCGKLGIADTLKYDHSTGRLLPTVETFTNEKPSTSKSTIF